MRIFPAIIFCFWIAQTEAQIEVCPDCPVNSVQQGLDSANPGDTVYVEDGVYRENAIIITKPVVLQGENWPVIDALEGKEAIVVAADSVTITGLVVRNVTTSYLEDRAGIRVRKSHAFQINGNRLENTFFGIYLEHSSHGEVVGNKLIGNAVDEMSSGNAIHLWYCKDVIISDNEVAHHRDGIYLEFVDSSKINNNVSRDNLRYGLHFMFSNDDWYAENTFTRNGAGVAVMFSRNIRMTQNAFLENWGKSSYGLLLKEIYDGEILDNYFFRNSIGIYVEGSNRINYHRNEFKRNGWAIKISGGCLDNSIEKNNFHQNTFDLSLNAAAEGQVIRNNYWSAYNGYDLDRNGIGDIPYRPVKLFNFIVNRTPESIVLLRSLFIDLINFSEKVHPTLTPVNLMDNEPSMRPFTFKELQ